MHARIHRRSIARQFLTALFLITIAIPCALGQETQTDLDRKPSILEKMHRINHAFKSKLKKTFGFKSRSKDELPASERRLVEYTHSSDRNDLQDPFEDGVAYASRTDTRAQTQTSAAYCDEGDFELSSEANLASHKLLPNGEYDPLMKEVAFASTYPGDDPLTNAAGAQPRIPARDTLKVNQVPVPGMYQNTPNIGGMHFRNDQITATERALQLQSENVRLRRSQDALLAEKQQLRAKLKQSSDLLASVDIAIDNSRLELENAQSENQRLRTRIVELESQQKRYQFETERLLQAIRDELDDVVMREISLTRQ